MCQALGRGHGEERYSLPLTGSREYGQVNNYNIVLGVVRGMHTVL